MRNRFASILLLATLGLTVCSASAFEFRGMADNAAVYDAGSKESKPLFILLRGTPVELIVTLDRWAKVREVGGGIGWVERSLLTERKQVIVTAAQLEIRQSTDSNSPVVLAVGKDVLLELLEGPTGGSIKVRHRDGAVGFVPVRSVWGI